MRWWRFWKRINALNHRRPFDRDQRCIYYYDEKKKKKREKKKILICNNNHEVVVQHIEPAHVCVCMLLLFIIFLFSYQCISLYAFDFFLYVRQLLCVCGICFRLVTLPTARSSFSSSTAHVRFNRLKSVHGTWALFLWWPFSLRRGDCHDLLPVTLSFSLSLFFKRYGELLAKMATSLFFNWKNRWKRSAFQMEIAKNLATLRLSARNEKLKRDALTRPWNMQMTLCIDFFFLPPSHTHRFGLHTHTHTKWRFVLPFFVARF